MLGFGGVVVVVRALPPLIMLGGMRLFIAMDFRFLLCMLTDTYMYIYICMYTWLMS